MIQAVIIPPVLDQPLRQVEIEPHAFATYHGVTGGNIQTHELRNPAMTLYSNCVRITPINIRATLILWVHNRDLAYHAMITGQALLTGNDEGADIDVPEEIIELIFKAQRYKIEVAGRGDGVTYEELPFTYAAAVYHTVPPTNGEVGYRPSELVTPNPPLGCV